ncbi:MAG: TonB-dependent receptor plug domain-containing protein [Verrucomicrobiales bacterium]|nr:TonB-dependent receptor plug domain-containing protein [Verrucomicrobiales bacterium]
MNRFYYASSCALLFSGLLQAQELETADPSPAILDDAVPQAQVSTTDVSTLEATVVSSTPTRPRPAPTRSVTGVSAPTVTNFEAVVSPGKAEDLTAIAPSASSGRASNAELMDRPFLRRGELLEVVPGMIVTQHSGGGKANQYFLRGFNLDHGTDFAIFVDNMPVNNRSHGHGQGYADINFLIPELVEELEYVKGPYFSRFGDFSTAGAARFRLYRELPQGIASFTIGSDNFYRGLLADSVEAGDGIATFALEYNYYDGPWAMPDELNRWNGFFRYVIGDEDDFASITLMGFDSTWNATDQVPSRLIDSGGIDRLGFVDPSVGGDSYRFSLSADFRKTGDSGITVGSVYAGKYQLDLFSNFTLFLDDPVNGDQFNQYDDRWFAGAAIDHTFDELTILDRDSTLSVGLQTHHDFINDIGLYKTSQRQRLSTVREDEIYEASFSAYSNLEVPWTDWLRTQAGIRGDLYHFDVDAKSLAANSGSAWDGIVSPKAGIVLGPWNETEFYLNGGFGFHSNDARGVTIAQDPLTGDPLSGIPGLVRTKGAEVGVRTQIIPNLTSSLALWYLESESELVYVGDAGNIEAGGASERYGIEWSNYWKPEDWLTIDTEFTVTEGQFVETGEEIENSVPMSFSGGITYGNASGPFASIRARYFSPRPLNGDGSVESKDALQINSRLGYRVEGDWEVALEFINLLDSNDNDVEYFYTSRLPGEAAAGIEDTHLHPYEPRQVRVSVTKHW